MPIDAVWAGVFIAPICEEKPQEEAALFENQRRMSQFFWRRNGPIGATALW